MGETEYERTDAARRAEDLRRTALHAAMDYCREMDAGADAMRIIRVAGLFANFMIDGTMEYAD